MGILDRFRKSELETVTEQAEKAEARVEKARGRAEKVGSWPKVTLMPRGAPSYLTGYVGEREHPTGSWKQQLRWDWLQASDEEAQQEVFKHYLNKLTYSQDLGYNKESAGRAIMSEIARMTREETKGV